MQQTTDGPSPALLRGRRVFDGIAHVTILEDWYFVESENKWVMKVRLHSYRSSGSDIADPTEWYLLVEDSYPWGSIKFHPAKKNGLVGTYPHQWYNSPDDNGHLPWTNGYLCLNTPLKALGRRAFDIEPFDTDSRLKWHCERAIAWLKLAAQGELLNTGDPFELPCFPTAEHEIVAFSENSSSLIMWEQIEETYGLVDLIPVSPTAYAVKQFNSTSGQALLEYRWGSWVSSSETPIIGCWIRLNNIPVTEPWQTPASWGELVYICGRQQIDILTQIKGLARFLRDGRNHIIMLGFPIPEFMGGPQKQMHWQAFTLPPLSTPRTATGFRNQESSLWRRDKVHVFGNNRPLRWLPSQNWSKEGLASRGALPDNITTKRLLIIGAGSLASHTVEQLVRAGSQSITIMDYDILEGGNLVRHTLDMRHIGLPKVTGLANSLNASNPYATVEPIFDSFPPSDPSVAEKLDAHDVILDCTGDDSVLQGLASFSWKSPKLFVSLSLGFGARRLYIFAYHGLHFPHFEVVEALQEWLTDESSHFEAEGLPREGIGCWHPVFPARVDDVSLLASTAVKGLEQLATSDLTRPVLAIYEQQSTNGYFQGVSLISYKELRTCS